MTELELIQNSAEKVRSDSKLMLVYIDFFTARFGEEPDCVGCTFKSDYQRLRSAVNNNLKIENTMINLEKTFTLKKGVKENIVSYKKKNRIHRVYISKMKDSFVTEYLTNGTEAEIKERAEIFQDLPKGFELKKTEKKQDKK